MKQMSSNAFNGEPNNNFYAKEQNQAVILPPGYDPNQIIVVHPDDKAPPLQTHQEDGVPRTALQHLESDTLQSKARLQFIRKVYILVTIMFLITMGACFLSYFVKQFYQFQIQNYWCFYTFLGISLVITIVVMCCGNETLGQTSSSFKMVLLFIFTLCWSYMVSFITSLYAEAYGAPVVLEAMVLTVGMCSALTLYAFIVRHQIVTMIAILIVVLFCFILFGISFAFTMSGTLHTLYATFGAIIGGIILVIDTNWIADGQRGCSLDDPVMGALIIYIDIIRIFLYILMAAGGKGRK